MLQKKPSPQEAELEELESLLQATLMPKLPRSSYGGDLQRRLSNRSAPVLEFPHQDYSLVWLFLTALFFMILTLWAIQRFIFTGRFAQICRKKPVYR